MLSGLFSTKNGKCCSVVCWVGGLLLYFCCATLLNADTHEQKIYRYGLYAGNSERFPDTQGIGWSDSIPYEIFSKAGYKIEVIELPAKRLQAAFLKGDIDSFILSKESLAQLKGKFLPSKYPLSTIAWKIYYDKTKGWSPVWPPDVVFKSKVGKSKQSAKNLKTKFGLNVSMSSSFNSVFKMVNAGRADYWVDNESGVKSFTPDSGQSIPEGFVFETLFRRGLYLIFRDDEKGRLFHNILTEGMDELISAGEFGRVYYANDLYFIDTNTVDNTMEFIRSEFPEKKIPDQKKPSK